MDDELGYAVVRDLNRGVGRIGVVDKADLHGYLRGARETLVWKLHGLGEYDIRRPMTPTGTNLLGLVKHSTFTHLRYLVDAFDHTDSSGLPTPPEDWGAQFWATADETKNEIVANYRRAWKLADATIDEHEMDAIGRVAGWGDGAVTLHRILVHVTAETQRHAGHADIIRELVDGSAGLLRGADNTHVRNASQRSSFFDRIEAAARLAGIAGPWSPGPTSA